MIQSNAMEAGQLQKCVSRTEKKVSNTANHTNLSWTTGQTCIENLGRTCHKCEEAGISQMEGPKTSGNHIDKGSNF